MLQLQTPENLGQPRPSPDSIVGPDQPTDPADGRAARAAARIGATTAVERLPFDLSVLLDEGLFVNVDARGFGLLDRRLDWQALGVTLPPRAGVAFRPPRCGLLPDRHRLPLLRPAARAHQALHRYSFTFRLTETLFQTPAYRWVPWRAWDDFEREFRAAQAALERAKAALLEEYDAVREEVLALFGRLAAESATRLAATGHPVAPGFEDAVVGGVLDALPGPADIRDRLTLACRPGVIWLGSEMVAEGRRVREARRQEEQAAAAAEGERRRREAAEHLVQQEFWAREERLRLQRAAEEEDRRREAATKERIRQLRVEAERERLREFISPLEESLHQLHAALHESAVAVRDHLARHGTLRGPAVKKALDLVHTFRVMAVQDDPQLAAAITEVERLARQYAGKPRGKRRVHSSGGADPTAVRAALDDITELTYASARALARPSRMGALEL